MSTRKQDVLLSPPHETRHRAPKALTVCGVQQQQAYDNSYSQQWNGCTQAERHILVRASINVLGALLFFVGSLGWVAAFPLTGTFLFAGSNIFCYCVTGIWWSRSAKRSFEAQFPDKTRVDIDYLRSHQGLPVTLDQNSHLEELTEENDDEMATYCHTPLDHFELELNQPEYRLHNSPSQVKAFRILTRMEQMAAFWQVAGAIAFTIGCFTSLYESIYFETVMFWLSGSFFFLIQSIISQIICESFWGPLLPLVPHFLFTRVSPFSTNGVCNCSRSICWHHCVPAAMLNWLGSVLFTVASVFLFYPSLEFLGGWGYLTGSFCFVVAAYADINGFLNQLAQSNGC